MGQRLTPDLEDAISEYIAAGWRVELMTSRNAVLVSGTKPNHLLHAVLALFTGGLWLIPWLIIAMTTKERRIAFRLDADGDLVQAGNVDIRGSFTLAQKVTIISMGVIVGVVTVAIVVVLASTS